MIISSERKAKNNTPETPPVVVTKRVKKKGKSYLKARGNAKINFTELTRNRKNIFSNIKISA